MLKRFLPRMLLLLALIACTGISRNTSGLRAQNGIGFGPQGFLGMPDTVYAGDSILVGAFIKNYSNLIYNDTLQIQGYIDTGAVVIPFSLPLVPQFILAPNDTLFSIIPVSFRDNHMNGSFRIGNNVIVVWPAVFNQNWGTHDSLMHTVFVIDTISGMAVNNPPDEGVKCYPVPANGPLYVSSNNPSLKPKEIVVRDVTGKIIYISTNPSFGIDTESWANGVYFLEVVFENKSRRTYKIVK